MPSEKMQNSKLYHFLRSPMMIPLIGALSALYAFASVALLLTLIAHEDFYSAAANILPFHSIYIAITPAVAFSVTSMFFWDRMVLRKQRWSFKHGWLAGLVSTLVAHP